MRNPRRSGVKALLTLGVWGVVSLVAISWRLSGASPTRIAGPTATVPPTFFGMHIHTPLTTTPWPDVPFKAWRLWDTGTRWSDLEPSQGQWYFGRLDQLVLLAASHDVDVLLCLGQTPRWASSDPDAGSDDRKGQMAPPKDMDDWRDYVRRVATRYRGKIQAYEIWNEPNLSEFYTGDVETMVQLTREAAQIIHSIDPAASVVSPSATENIGVEWLNAFLKHGGARYVDVIGFHFYVIPEGPEEIVPLARSVEATMTANDVHLPLWDTETGWSKPKVFSGDYEAGAYVARSLLLAWTSGINRFYWYAWDNHDWVTLELTTGDDSRPNANALAYKTIESWMAGERVESCTANASGTWACHLSDASTGSYIFWNPEGKSYFQYPSSSRSDRSWIVTDLSGKSIATTESKVVADMQPRLMTPVRASGG
jgi:Glycosyl hydrolases family 39